MTAPELRLEAARMRQRADAMLRLAKWVEDHDGGLQTRVLDLSQRGIDAATISASLQLSKGYVTNLRTSFRKQGVLRKRSKWDTVRVVM